MAVLIVLGGTLGGALLGFVIPFSLAQFMPSYGPALSFVPMITVPLGFLLGLIGGIFWAVYR
ncbi:MAG TPA: hypothetical protein PLY93_14630 [Turneriella sp.]|nr:hypothetical protein [Turneriella sp.]